MSGMFEYRTETVGPARAWEATDVLTASEVCSALQISKRTLDRLDLPTVYLGTRSRRYVWGMILDILKERAA